MGRIPHVKAGEPITAELFNEVAERLERFANLTSTSPFVRIWETPTGKAIALAFPEPTYALLSGSTSPYSFTEVRDGPGGTWVAMPNGDSGTNNVYECNAKSGLGGKVVPIEWTSAGDWRFQWVGTGCNPANTRIVFTVRGCQGQLLAGATVAVTKAGSPIASGTTNGSGSFTANVTATGTYDYTITYPRFNTITGTATVTACGTQVNVGQTFTVQTGYVCCGNAAAYPTTLYLTTSQGTVTLTWDSVSGTWLGTQTSGSVNAYSGTTCPGGCGPICGVAPSMQAVDVHFVVSCAFFVGETWTVGGGGGSCFNLPGCTSGIAPPTALPVAGCSTPTPGVNANAGFSGGTFPVLPQTATIPAVDSTYGCPTPISGSVVLSE